MASSQDLVLGIIRDHPEGLTTREIAEFLPDGIHPSSKISKAYTRCTKLQHWGLVEKEIIEGHGKNVVAVWRAVDDS